jgi:hypothetical protein
MAAAAGVILVGVTVEGGLMLLDGWDYVGLMMLTPIALILGLVFTPILALVLAPAHKAGLKNFASFATFTVIGTLAGALFGVIGIGGGAAGAAAFWIAARPDRT